VFNKKRLASAGRVDGIAVTDPLICFEREESVEHTRTSIKNKAFFERFIHKTGDFGQL